jgi:predicted DNA-binding protein
MASVETTTIRVRRSTHERLQKQAELTGQSVTQVLEEAAGLLEEAKLMEAVEDHFERMAERTPEEIARSQARDEEWVRELEALPPSPRED